MPNGNVNHMPRTPTVWRIPLGCRPQSRSRGIEYTTTSLSVSVAVHWQRVLIRSRARWKMCVCVCVLQLGATKSNAGDVSRPMFFVFFSEAPPSFFGGQRILSSHCPCPRVINKLYATRN